MLPFWNTLYSNVLLEFMYVNKLSWPVPKIEVVRGVGVDRDQGEGPGSRLSGGGEDRAGRGESTTTATAAATITAAADAAARRILLPLGGECASHSSFHSSFHSSICSSILSPFLSPFLSSLLSLLSSPSPCLSLGGKDSLVSWHIALTQGLSPVLMYVADGNDEYEENWRLKEIVRTIGSGVHLGDFLVLMPHYNLSVDMS